MATKKRKAVRESDGPDRPPARATGTRDEECRQFYARAHARDALEVKVEELEQRLEALERAQAARRKPSVTLAAQAARRRHSLALRSEIQSVMVTHSGPERLTAKRVAKLLGRDPSPSIRTIQDHMREINAASSVPRF